MDQHTKLTFEVAGNTAPGIAAINNLKNSFTKEFAQMNTVANSALSSITSGLTNVANQSPIVGQALGGVTSQLGSMSAASTGAGAGLATMAAGAVVGAAAIGALVAGVGLAAKGFFALVVSTAEAEGALLDLSQKTNFSVETLSALSLLAKTTGSDINTLSGTLVIFQSNMVKAAEGGDHLSKTFKDLNISTHDQELALRQAITALAAMGETEKQAAAAKELFGRAGKDVLAIVKETNGDLDKASEQFAKLGLIISTEAAIAADKFNDTLTLLEEQITAVGRTLAQDTIPIFIAFFEDIGKFIAKDANAWEEWRNVVTAVVAVVLGTFEGFVGWMATHFQGDLTAIIDSSINSLIQRGIELQAVLGVQAVTARAAAAAASGIGTRTSSGGGKAKSEQDEVYKAALEASKEAAAKELETQRHLGESLKITYEENKANLEEYYKGRQTLIDAHTNTLIDAINREQQSLDEAIERGLIKAEEASKKNAELTQRAKEVDHRTVEETRKNDLERQKALDKEELDLNTQLVAIREAQRQAELSRIKLALDKGDILESESIARRAAVEKQGFEDRTALLDLELAQLATSAARKVALDNEKIASEIKYTTTVEESVRARLRAEFDEQNAPAAGAARKRRSTDPDKSEKPDLSIWEHTIDGIEKLLVDFNDFVGTTLVGTLRSLAGALGESVRAWALYGESLGKSMRKAAAEAIAAIASQAIVQGALHAAYALGSLAFGNFGDAAKHAIAAAKFFAVGALAGLGARAIAGNAFTGSASAGSASSGAFAAGGAATGGNPPEVQPIDVGRRLGGGQAQSADIAAAIAQGMQGMVLRAEITRDEGSSVRMWIDNYRKNGEVRQVVREDS